jgi:transcriptional regulator with XRE-family HTH domain
MTVSPTLGHTKACVKPETLDTVHGMTTLGQRVRQLRHEAGLTLLQLSGPASLSVSYLNDIEHDRTVPRLDALIRIGHGLGISVTELLRGVADYDTSPDGRKNRTPHR